ncbi:MAG: acyl-CoA thioesterase [Eubacteriales bacterium]|nr:acyl-CoA thioesterase [Eubacteriales bacterium]
MQQMKTIDTRIEAMHIVQNADLNGAQKLFGGRLMEWMDEAAVLSARRYAKCEVVTGTVDSIVFYRGAQSGDAISIEAQVTYTTKSTMEVRVMVHVVHMNGVKELINKAYFVMVTVPNPVTGEKVILPELILESEKEKQEWKNGSLRNQIRIERRMENI